MLFNVRPDLQWQQIHPGIFGIVANIVATVAVSLATPPMDPDHIRDYVVY